MVGPVLLPGTTGASKFAIIKITDRRAAGAFSLDDPDFRGRLQRTIAENRMLEELVAELKQRSLVEYRLD